MHIMLLVFGSFLVNLQLFANPQTVLLNMDSVKALIIRSLSYWHDTRVKQ